MFTGLRLPGASADRDSAGKSAVESVLQKPFTTLSDYAQFWAGLESDERATSFFAMLAQRLLAAERGKQTSDIALGVSNASVFTTLLLLVLYYPIKASRSSRCR